MAALDAVALRNCLRRALPTCPDDISAQRRNDWGDLGSRPVPTWLSLKWKGAGHRSCASPEREDHFHADVQVD